MIRHVWLKALAAVGTVISTASTLVDLIQKLSDAIINVRATYHFTVSAERVAYCMSSTCLSCATNCSAITQKRGVLLFDVRVKRVTQQSIGHGQRHILFDTPPTLSDVLNIYDALRLGKCLVDKLYKFACMLSSFAYIVQSGVIKNEKISEVVHCTSSMTIVLSTRSC